ncbi:hypothetical protein [Sinomonas flava]|uniref:O-antigen ligase n=1 Tax=Sinomonas flava TaxID=496857 RepID=A0ABN3BPJ7_9MICC
MMAQTLVRSRPTALSAVAEIRVSSFLEFLLFACFVLEGAVIPGVPVPGSDIAVLILVAWTLFRRPRASLASAQWYLPFWIGLLFYLAVESIVNEADWVRRATRLGLMVTLTMVIATGRVNLRNGLVGVLAGGAVNVVLFYLGVAPNTYGGVLMGYLGDKNVAGMFYCLTPLLLLPFVERAGLRKTLVVYGFVTVFLTGSRTSLTAFAIAVGWLTMTKRMPRVFQLPVLALAMLLVNYLEENFSQSWIFKDRAGSDELRERIGEAAAAKAATSPPYGLGLGEAMTTINGHPWFFHDSYLGLYVEGGWVALFGVVGLFVVLGLGPLSRHAYRRIPALEGAMVALLICGLKLGEVFLSLSGFLLLGCLLVSRAAFRPAVDQRFYRGA